MIFCRLQRLFTIILSLKNVESLGSEPIKLVKVGFGSNLGNFGPITLKNENIIDMSLKKAHVIRWIMLAGLRRKDTHTGFV